MMGFDKIVGQDRIKAILRLALQRGRLPNSLLFIGPDGVGKRMLALTLSQALNCLTLADDACGRCSSCLAIARGWEDGTQAGFPDVKEIVSGGPEEPPDESPEKRDEESGKNTIKIRQVRYLKYYAYRKPMVGKKRIFIITEAEKMTGGAASAFLKVLEEPPPLTHFILLTAFPDLILPTIQSRCMILRLGQIPREEIERQLLARGWEENRARVLAFLSGGSLEAALRADWEEVEARRRRAWDLLRSLLRQEGGADFVTDFGFLRRSQAGEELARLWETMSIFLRDLLLAAEGADSRYLMNPDYEEEVHALAAGLDRTKIQETLAGVDRALAGLDKNLNLGLLVSSFYSNIIER
jgi:DNA polymerase-3 subunit delta'